MQGLKFRASGVGNLMVGNFGLTYIQESKLFELEQRAGGLGKPLTPNMEVELQELRYKKANPQLSETAKTFVRNSVIEFKTKRRKEIKSKYLEKGILVEQDSVDLLCDVTGEFYDHRTTRITDDYFTGECDLLSDNKVTDIKSSFDIFTFFESDFKDLYYWQGQVYCRLYNKQYFDLAYCLVDMPRAMFKSLNDKLLAEYGFDTYNEKYVKALTQLSNNCFFGELSPNPIPINERLKIFSCERNESDIQRLIERVEAAHKYADNFWNSHIESSKKFLK